MIPPPDVELLDSLCARAWAPLESEEADGWVLRAANGFSLRANSVWPRERIGEKALESNIERAEAFYAARSLPPRFQLSPAADPELETALVARGYALHTTTDVMVATALAAVAAPAVELRETADQEWRDVMVDSTGDAVDARGRLAIVDTIRLPRRHALARVDGEAAAIGLGVADGDWVGIFAMRTIPAFRRRGLARAIVTALRQWSATSNAYLQVEADNDAAIALYRRLGFERAYSYRYASRSL